MTQFLEPGTETLLDEVADLAKLIALLIESRPRSGRVGEWPMESLSRSDMERADLVGAECDDVVDPIPIDVVHSL